MPIGIQPLPYEELSLYVKICQAGFTRGIGSVLFHGGAAATPANFEDHVVSTQKSFVTDKSSTFIKAVDTTTNQIMGVAKWNIFPAEQTPEQLETTLGLPIAQETLGCESTFLPVFEILSSNRRTYMGTRPYVFLSVLCIDPSQQRRGAGAALVQWGTHQADDLGIPTYVESSIDGQALYEKMGFRVVRSVEFEDMDKRFGRGDLEGQVDVNHVMIRNFEKRTE